MQVDRNLAGAAAAVVPDRDYKRGFAVPASWCNLKL